MGSTASRTGPPCAALTGLPCSPVATSTSRRRAWSSVRLSLYDPSYEVNRTAVASGCGPAAASRSGSATPDQVTAGTRQPVTHWKSRTSVACGSRASSAIDQVRGRRTSPPTAIRTSAGARRGIEAVTE